MNAGVWRLLGLPLMLDSCPAPIPSGNRAVGAGESFDLLLPARRSRRQIDPLGLRSAGPRPVWLSSIDIWRKTLRILIVEDEVAIAEAVRAALRADGHAADVVGDGRDALDWVAAYSYDLLLLDVVLPGLDGFAVCSAVRANGFSAAILMLTALDDVQDRISGLDRGADDYLAKPFSMGELRARVRALGRRRLEDRMPVTRVGDLELDPATLDVRRAGRSIRLTAREFALLELLARHPGQVFTRDRLIDALWGADFAAESNIVEVYIRSLRRKVDQGRRDGLIETVRGSGYRLRPAEPG
jgi:two-component system OmpR family response regulator